MVDERPPKRAKLGPRGVKNARGETGDACEDPLAELELIYTKLMSYYTFLSTRKHIIPAFQVLKTPAEAALGRPLTKEDVARLKVIAPWDINFEYVDKDQFILEDKHFTWKQGFEQKESDMFKLEDTSNSGGQILIVEFVDGNLAKKSRASSGFNTNMKLPQYSPEAVKKLILRRKDRFAKALQEFRTVHPLDAWNIICDEAQAYIPTEQELINPIEAMNDTVLASEHRPMEDVISKFKAASFYDNQLTSIHRIPSRPTKLGEMVNFELHPEIWKLLNSKGIKTLYSHQTRGLDSIAIGKHVISTTPTSSGKSLIYQLPILNTLIYTPEVTSILLFPTKALSQDQYRTLREFSDELPFSSDLIATYDGDTEKETRQWVRENASVLLTNPDTLHASVIPQHERWSRVLRNLRFVVVDEMHAYRGTFGAHVALILRRLRRICAIYGNHNLQFVASSATLKDAESHFSKMVGVDESLVDWISEKDDGSPCGQRSLVGWSPNSANGSMIGDTAKLIVELAKLKVRTIVFCSIRKTVELVMKEVRAKLKHDPELVRTIMSYRGGYSAKDRRKIENKMFSGSLNCIVATNALEVGIDIGGLDVVLMCGFPVSLSSFEQEMGRAGRRGLESMCMLVSGTDPVSQYYVTKMDQLVNNKQWDDLCVDLKNLMVLEAQIQCAFHELPVSNDTLGQEWINWFNFVEWDVFEMMVREKLKWDTDWNKWTCADSYLPHPPMQVSIRSIEEESYAVVDTTGDNGRQEIIEQVETSRMTFTLYEGGIFIHQGLPYLVREVNSDDKYAIVQRTNVDWTTSQRDFTDVDPVLIERIKVLTRSSVNVYFGNILKTSVVFGFFKMSSAGKILDAVEVNNPPIKYHSKGVWIDVDKPTLEMVKDHALNIPGAIHAVQHAIMNIIPKSISVGSKDEMNCECKAPEKEFASRQSQRKRPSRIILFDNKGGKYGCGLSSRVFEMIDTVLVEALKAIEACDCEYGCPNCCAGYQCTENSLVLSKWGAIAILRSFLGISQPLNGIPRGPEPNMPEITIETVVGVDEFAKVPVSSLVEIEESSGNKEDTPAKQMHEIVKEEANGLSKAEI